SLFLCCATLRRSLHFILFPYTTLFRSFAFLRAWIGWASGWKIRRRYLPKRGCSGWFPTPWCRAISRFWVMGRLLSLCATTSQPRSEEHTSELQSREKLGCRPLLEKKKT